MGTTKDWLPADRGGGCTKIFSTLTKQPLLKEDDWLTLSSEKLGIQPHPLLLRASRHQCVGRMSQFRWIRFTPCSHALSLRAPSDAPSDCISSHSATQSNLCTTDSTILATNTRRGGSAGHHPFQSAKHRPFPQLECAQVTFDSAVQFRKMPRESIGSMCLIRIILPCRTGSTLSSLRSASLIPCIIVILHDGRKSPSVYSPPIF